MRRQYIRRPANQESVFFFFDGVEIFAAPRKPAHRQVQYRIDNSRNQVAERFRGSYFCSEYCCSATCLSFFSTGYNSLKVFAENSFSSTEPLATMPTLWSINVTP